MLVGMARKFASVSHEIWEARDPEASHFRQKIIIKQSVGEKTGSQWTGSKINLGIHLSVYSACTAQRDVAFPV